MIFPIFSQLVLVKRFVIWLLILIITHFYSLMIIYLHNPKDEPQAPSFTSPFLSFLPFGSWKNS